MAQTIEEVITCKSYSNNASYINLKVMTDQSAKKE
jgi:hypothetical protein